MASNKSGIDPPGADRQEDSSLESGSIRSSRSAGAGYSGPRLGKIDLLLSEDWKGLANSHQNFPERIPYVSESGGHRWAYGMAGGLGLALAQRQPQFWLGLEAEYHLHRKWSIWSRLAYQWNTFGPEIRSDDQEAALGERFNNLGTEQTNRVFFYRQQPEELAAHRVGLLLGGAFRPHRAIRLETAFQMNYLSTYTFADQPPPFPSSAPSQSIELQERKLDIKAWEPVLHLGFYWRLNPAFQLGATWQQTLTEMSRTESYSLRPSQLSLSFRLRIRK
jgi:hypothetical protein